MLKKIDGFIERHTISLHGEMFFCVLRDSRDHRTKVVPLAKIASLVEERTAQ
jgi:hypothetical protein